MKTTTVLFSTLILLLTLCASVVGAQAAGTLVLDGGYAAVPQGATLNGTITKSGGQDFVAGMTISVDGSGLTGSVTQVVSVDEIDVEFVATRRADVGVHNYEVKDGATVVADGTVACHYPQQRVTSRQGGTSQEPPRNGTVGANGVYLHNGEFRHDLPILSIPGRVLPLSVGITYRSQLEYLGPLGAGWTASWDRRVVYDSGADEVVLYSGSGRIDTFELQGGGTSGEGPYVKPGFFFVIERDDNGTGGDDTDDEFTISYAHGSTATFEASNLDTAGQQLFRQTTFEDRYGNTVEWVYNSDGQLTAMLGDMYNAGTSATRYKLSFSYHDDGRLDTITDYADYAAQSSIVGGSYTGNREWEFVYNSDAQLTEIKLPKTEEYFSDTKGSTYRTRVQFTYDSNDNLVEVIDARQANESAPMGWLKNHYDGSDRVDYQDVGRDSPSDTTHRQHIVYTSSTDVSFVNAEGHRSQYLLNGDGTASTMKHYTGEWDSSLTQTASKIRSGDPSSFDTSYEYDSEFHVIEVTYPRGNETHLRFDIATSVPGATCCASWPTLAVPAPPYCLPTRKTVCSASSATRRRRNSIYLRPVSAPVRSS